MATSGTRDVTLGVGIKTTGEDSLRSLQREVETLAKKGGEAGPAFQHLADELGRLATQANAVESLRAVAADVDALAEREAEATAKATELGRALVTQRDALASLRSTQVEAQRGFNEQKEALSQARYELGLLNIEYPRGERNVQEYRDRLATLSREILDGKFALQGKREALVAANQAVGDAERSETKLQGAYARSTTAAEQAGRALTIQRDAMLSATAAAAALGVEVNDLDAAETQLLETQQRQLAEARLLQETSQRSASYLEFWAKAADELAAAEAAAATETERLRKAQQDATAYADQMIAAERRLADTLRDTAAAATALNEETLQAAQTADRVKFWAQAFDQLAAAERAAAEDAERLARIQREGAAYAEQLVAAEREAAQAMREVAQATTAANEAAQRSRENADNVRFWAKAFDELAAREQEAKDKLEAFNRAQQEATAYADQLIAAERKVAQEMRDVAAATTAANEAALRASRNADYLRFWAQAADELAAREREAAEQADFLAKAGERASAALKEAFGQAGVRSLQAIQSEVSRVNQAVGLLQREFNAGNISATDFSRAIGSAQVRLAQLRQEAQSLPELPGVFERMNSTINSLVSRFGSLSAAIATVGFAVKPVLDVNIGLESLRRSLTAVTGSAAEAEKQIGFLRETALRNGLAVGQLTDSFQGFTASMLKSGLSARDTQTLFSGVAAAAGTLGISTERTSNILLGLSQVANKGKVSLEEIQGQIGEALPGALKLAADSLGVTTAELGKLMQSGKLLAEDFLPLFGKQLQKEFGAGKEPVKGLAQAFNDLKTQATITAQGLADTSAYKSLTSSIESLAKNFDSVVTYTVAAGKAFAAFKAIDMAREFLGIKAASEAAAAGKAKDVAATVEATAAERTATTARAASTAAVTTNTEALAANTLAKRTNATAAAGSLTALDAMSNGFAKVAGGAQSAVGRIGSFTAALGGPWGVALTGAVAFAEPVGKWLAKMAADLTGVTAELERNEKALKKQADAEKAAAEQSKVVAAEKDRTVAQEIVANEKLLATAENNVKVAGLQVKAKKEQGEASVALAELAGNEERTLRAAADAAGANEVATRNLLAAKRSHVEAMEAEVAAIIQASGGEAKLSNQRRDQIKELREKIEAAKQDVEVTRQQAEVEGVVADKAFQAARAFGDQSTQVELLKSKLDGARDSYAFMLRMFEQGLATQASVNQAARTLADTQGLLKNAIDDTTKALERRSALAKADSDVTISAIRVDSERARSLEALAQLNGDEATATSARISQKQAEVQVMEVKNRLLREQAQDELVTAQNARDELERLGQLTPEKKQEIELRIRNAQAKRNEAAAGDAAVSSINAEIEAMRRRAAASAAAAGPGKIDGSGTTAFNASLKKNESGVGAPVDNSYVFNLWARYQRGEVGPADLAAAKNALQVQKNNTRLGGPGSVSLQGRQDDQVWLGRLQQIVDSIENYKPDVGVGFGRSTGGSGGATGIAPQAVAEPSSASSGGSYTVNVNMGGTTRSINTASASDADKLASLLRELELSSGRANA